MPKRQYLLALTCYLLIPVVLIAGAGAFQLIDPELARFRSDYVRDYRLLDMARTGALLAAGGLAFVLWIACCALVLRSRHRSLRWLALAAAGPFGFIVIAMLGDRAPAPGDRYQRFISTLKLYGRVPLEIALFVAAWALAYELVVLERELMIALESSRTGTPVADIIARQAASSGMWAAGEGMVELYLLTLFYLLWPVVFNLAGALFPPRSTAAQRHA
jgi:hypothetical protein